MTDETEVHRQIREVKEEEERRGVPRTTTTGDPETDVRQPGDAALATNEPTSDDLDRDVEGEPGRPPPSGRPGPPAERDRARGA